MIFQNEAALVNFVFIVLDQGVIMFTLENLIVECNLKGKKLTPSGSKF